MKRNSENGCDFLKFAVSHRSGHCAYPPRSPDIFTHFMGIRCLPVTLCGQLLYVRNTQSMLQTRAVAVGTLTGDGLKNPWFGWS